MFGSEMHYWMRVSLPSNENKCCSISSSLIVELAATVSSASAVGMASRKICCFGCVTGCGGAGASAALQDGSDLAVEAELRPATI